MKVNEETFLEEHKRHQRELEAMTTPEGLRAAIAKTFYGKGEVRCRSSDHVTSFDVADPNVQIRVVTIQARGSYLLTDPKSVEGIRLVRTCSSSHRGLVNLGEFYSSSLGLECSSAGDVFISDPSFLGINGYYIDELFESLNTLGAENLEQRRRFGAGFLDEHWKNLNRT